VSNRNIKIIDCKTRGITVEVYIVTETWSSWVEVGSEKGGIHVLSHDYSSDNTLVQVGKNLFNIKTTKLSN